MNYFDLVEWLARIGFSPEGCAVLTLQFFMLARLKTRTDAIDKDLQSHKKEGHQNAGLEPIAINQN